MKVAITEKVAYTNGNGYHAPSDEVHASSADEPPPFSDWEAVDPVTRETVNNSPGASAKPSAARGEGKQGKPKQADILYRLAIQRIALFTGQDGESYAFVPADDHRECHKLRTKNFRSFLANIFYESEETIPGAQAVQDAIGLLEWAAQQREETLYVRVAGHNGKVYIDLGNAKWDAIEVDSSGWRIVETPPVAFKRSKAMGALPYPKSGGKLAAFKEFINVEADDWPLVVAWMICAYYPKGPFPVLNFGGEQGSAKSTTERAIKALIDPSIAALRGQPEDIRDLMIAANNNWLLAYDNISYLSNSVSDALCRISTGGGYATRSLYTDNDELIIDVTRPVLMNGITNIINRPDLMDRSLVIEVPILSENKRRDEKSYWAAFEEKQPYILGALLEALSVALRNLPTVKLDKLPRMADFAKLATAAETAMGLESGEFMRLYSENRESGTNTLVESSVLAQPLKLLVAVSGKWQGTPTELLDELEKIADDRAKNSKAWPNSANKLSAELKRLAPSLRLSHTVDARSKKSNGKRTWIVERLQHE
jgi:hypothetical protein